MAGGYNFVINAQLQADPASLARTASQVRGTLSGINVPLNINSASAQSALAKVASSAQATRAALASVQAAAASANASFGTIITASRQGASSLENLGAQAGLAARRFLAFSLAAGSLVQLVSGIKSATKAAVDFDLAMNKVAQVSGDSTAELNETRQIITQLATSLGVSSAALAETDVTLKQAGLTAQQTNAALKALALTDLAPTFESMKQSTEGLIAAFRQFNLTGRDFESSLGSINAVAAAFAVESADIITAIQRAGGAFRVAAGDTKTGTDALNEFVALFTSVRDTTRESAESIATGLRTVFTRLQRQDTVKALADLQINLRYTREEADRLGQTDLTNQFVGAYEAVKRLSEGLDGLRTTDPRYSQVIEQLGGYRQISRVIPLLQQFETAQKALNIAQSGQLSLQAAAEKRQEALSNRVSKLKEEYLALFRSIVDSKAFKTLADGFLIAANGAKAFLDATRPILPFLTTLAAIKLVGGAAGIVGGFGRSFFSAPGTAVRKFASGGVVPGAGNEDSEHALLMPGEFVLNKHAVAKVGVPALRDLNEGRSKLKLARYASGSREPVGGVSPDTQTGSDLKAAAADLKAAAAALSAVTGHQGVDTANSQIAAASAGKKGSSLLDRLRSKQGNTAVVSDPTQAVRTDDIAASVDLEGVAARRKAEGQGILRAEQSKAQAVLAVRGNIIDASGFEEKRAAAASVSQDSSLAEAARNRAAIAAADKGATPGDKASFVSKLKTPEQLALFSDKENIKYAERVAQFHSYKAGAVGEKVRTLSLTDTATTEGLARGIDKYTSLPPEQQSRENLNKYIRRGVGAETQRAIRSIAGPKGKRFYGTESEAPENVDELVAAPGGDTGRAETLASLAAQKAQLEGVVGGPLNVGDRNSLARLGQNLGVKGAFSLPDEATDTKKSLQQTVAEAARARIAASNAAGGGGSPPSLPALPSPGGPDDPKKRKRFPLSPEEIAYQESQLAVAKDRYGDRFGVPGDVLSRRERVLQATNIRDASASDADLVLRRNRDASVDPLLVARESRRARLHQQGIANRGDDLIQGRLDAHATAYQDRQLAAAREEQGSLFGVPGDEIAAARLARDREGAARAERVAARSTEDPLLTARDTRAERNALAVAKGDATTQRIAARALRDKQGVGGVTDPLALKQAAISAFRNGEGGVRGDEGSSILSSVKGQLSPAQYAQVFDAARKAGLKPGDQLSPVPDLQDKLSKSQYEKVGRAADAARAIRAQGQITTDAGGFIAGKDNQVLPTGLVDFRARQRAEAKIAGLGGSDLLSEGTKDKIRSAAAVKEEQRVREELISAQKNLITKLQPTISRTEAYLKATEDAGKALAGQAKIVTDSKGKILGLSQTVDQANSRGIQAAGASSPGLLSRLGSGFGDSRLGRLSERFSDLSGTAKVALVGAAGFGVSRLTKEIDERGGTAEKAATSAGAAATFTRNRAVSGGINDALTGAASAGAVGFAVGGGPAGAALFGAVGALAGAVSGVAGGLRQAAEEIRQAKIEHAISQLGEKLSSFASGIPDGSTITSIKNNLDVYEKESAERTKKAATDSYLFGLISTGVDAKKYGDFAKSDLRKEVAPLLPNINQGLTRQAEQFGRANPNARGADLNNLIKEFRATGQNDRLLQLVARLNETTGRVEDDKIRKVIVSAQQAATREQENRRGRANVEQDANSFGRLLAAVNAAAESLHGLQVRSSALTDVLDGQVQATRVGGRSDAFERLGAGDGGVSRSLDLVASFGGPQGRRLRSLGGAVDSVSGVLPGILASVPSTHPLAGGDVNSEVSAAIYRALGQNSKSAPADLRRVVEGIVSQLNEAQDGGKGPGGVLDEIKIDVSKFAEKLISGSANPVKEFGEKLNKLIEDNGNRLVDGLASIAQRVQGVGALYDQIESARTSNFRQNLQFSAEAAGRGHQFLDFASVGQLEHGFNSRQTRLAGVNGPQAFDPSFLGGELARVRRQIGPAVDRQQQAFERSGTPEGQAAFRAAAEEVIRLKDRASNLTQALKHLADTSERNAVVQEKLSRLQQEKEGRLGLAERVATAGPEELARIQRGFLLAKDVNNGRKLDSFGSEDRRLIIDTLRSASGVTLTGFAGAPRAEDLLKKALSEFAGGAFGLTPQQRAEEGALKGEVVGRGTVAEQALAALAKVQEAGVQDLNKILSDQNNQFLTKLFQVLSRNELQDAVNKKAAAEVEKRELVEKQGGAISLLNNAGVSGGDQLKALRERKGDLEEFRNAVQARDLAAERIAEARKALAANPTDALNNRAKFLTGQGLNDSVDRVEQSFNKNYKSLKPGEGSSVAFDRALRSELTQKGGLYDQRQADVRAAGNKIKGIAGVNFDAVEGALSNKDSAQKFLDALNAFGEPGNKMETFGARVDEVNLRLRQLNEQIELLKRGFAVAPAPAAGPVAVGKAGGGPIFQPVGTDTVPAMLTPGEFVINASSAVANLGLLHAINAARGPVTPNLLPEGFGAPAPGAGAFAKPSYYADGGRVNPWADVIKKLRKDEEQEVLRERIRARRQIDVPGFQVAAGAAYNFNVASGVANGRRRPGDEGQRAIATRILDINNAAIDRRYKTDPDLQKFLAARSGIRLPANPGGGQPFSRGGVVPGVQHLSRGGAVAPRYYAGGGEVSGGDGFQAGMSQFSQAAQSMAQAFNVFNGSATALAQALSNMPSTLTVSGQHQVNVVINGAEALAKLTPEIKEMVTADVKAQLGRIFKEQMPDAGVQVD